jgi:23S rRNA-/tRNA-specific pseudouridylate synthase
MQQTYTRIAHHVTGERTTVAGCLEKHFKLGEAQVKELLRLGAVYLDKRRVTEDRVLEKGSYLRVHLEPKRFPVSGVDWKSRIVRETPEFLIVNKPAGVPVHASLDNLVDNVLHQLRAVSGEELLVTQRLDVPVAGLLVLARTAGFQRRFNTWLGERKVKKIYRALTERTPTPGHHVHYMEPSERSPKRVTSEETAGWLRCELVVSKVQERALGNPPRTFFDIEIELLTGRTHQIRAQLEALKSPILGDRLYGARKSYRNRVAGQEGIALFSERVGFPNPGGPPWEFSATPPWILERV